MIIAGRTPSACPRHRAALLDFVDGRVFGPGTDAALVHLDACPRCRAELSETLVAITALRRIASEARTVDPPADAWARILGRIDRPRAPVWVAQVSMASLIVASAVAAMVLAPAATTGLADGSILEEAGTDPGAVAVEAHRQFAGEARTELRFVATRLPGPSSPGRWRGPSPRPDPDRLHPATTPSPNVLPARAE